MDSSQVIATSEGYEITASTATKELVKFLKSFGYLDYKMCMTPYKYQGYSDTAGGHDTVIEYKKPRI